MRKGTIAFLLGILVFLQFRVLPSDLWFLFFPLIVTGIFYFSGLKFFLVFFCGLLWTFFRADLVLHDQLERSIEGETVSAIGTVINLPEQNSDRVRFNFKIDEIIDHSGANILSPGKVRLSWYKNKQKVKPGERWLLSVRLKQPYGFRNPGGFDYEAWLFQQKIRATAYVRNDGVNQRLEESSSLSINAYRDEFRSLLQNISSQQLGDFEKGFLLALSIGDRSAVTNENWKVLRKTGTNHLLAISGLHIGIIAGLFFFLGRWAWSIVTPLSILMPAQRFALLSAMLAALIYAALAGFSIPTQRALIMLSVWMLMRLFYRNIAISKVLAWALLAVLIVDPFSVLDPGFWLSFMAVLIIVFGMSCRVDTSTITWRGIWWQWGRVQYLIATGLLPVLIVWFHDYPVLGIIANIVAIPLVSFVILPLVLIGSGLLLLIPNAGEPVLYLAGQALIYLWSFLETLSEFDIHLWNISPPSSLVFVFGLLGVALILVPKGMPARYLGFIFLLPLLLPLKGDLEVGEFSVSQLDVGQGLSAVVQTKNHALIYDAGDKFSQRFNAGDAVVIPFLRNQNIHHPDVFIGSHGDRDHIGGKEPVLKAYPALEILSSVPEKMKQTGAERCYEGQSWQWDGVQFEILNPPEESTTTSLGFSENDKSCVLRVSNADYSVLFTGDIERSAERRLVKVHEKKLRSSVLIAPHHGSRTSSSEVFIDAVSPKHVVFPVGYQNRFGFPKQDIISRYEARDVGIFNTARDGAVTFRFEISGMTVQRHRINNWRFWHAEY